MGEAQGCGQTRQPRRLAWSTDQVDTHYLTALAHVAEDQPDFGF